VEGNAFRDASGVICRLVSVAVAALYRDGEAGELEQGKGEARYRRLGFASCACTEELRKKKIIKKGHKNRGSSAAGIGVARIRYGSPLQGE
jgi:hypothetical protein